MTGRYDMHCHLSLMANSREVAEGAQERDINMLAVSVTPADAAAAHRQLDGCARVRTGLGLHPWWLADGRCGETEIARFMEAVRDARFIGEIGVDAGRKCAGTQEMQLDVLTRMAAAVRDRDIGRRVLSIHAVRSAGAVLDVLERFELTSRHACIFHWFTGSSDELVRARSAGCYFSINERMLATKRGREYARTIPVGSLLLETDAPPVLGETYAAELIDESLARSLASISTLRGIPAADLEARIESTSSEVLGM
ncbi:TatD-related deoxyribonuclease [Coriobacterium glomerans PW2]|uniref:TatD-related deoxyribonuclease n=1 Tax=Coriobacterium glomerans (strain ATCC 49209 / DSM 20642 / JCM 10262 / PW2) TaxID=700015 RepID=F2N7L1_CORGP|nr:TatD family hydrolase [Coriobacterium glomerans]AEB06827.1 TatD-related deoxyribonuclease [Coriobacterium glomerans PW2]